MSSTAGRLGWVDVARGIAILLVVLWHTVGILSSLGIPTSDVWHRVLAATGPMRIPGFFLVSGIFVQRYRHRPRTEFLGRRVQPFLHMFIIWAGVTFLTETAIAFGSQPVRDADVTRGVPLSYVTRLESPLWYLMALAVFHLVWWATRAWPPAPMLCLSAAAWIGCETRLLHLPPAFDSTGFHGMLEFLFFFLLGVRFGPTLQVRVTNLGQHQAVAIVAGWLLVEVTLPDVPFRSLVAVPALLAGSRLLSGPVSRWLAVAGRNSLPLYLMNWTLACAAALVPLGLPEEPLIRFLVPLVVHAAVVVTALLVWLCTRRVPGLYGRAAWLERLPRRVIASLAR